jgi:hypothetical protein
VVEFTPYVETKAAAQGKQSNLALWVIGGLAAYQLLKK